MAYGCGGGTTRILVHFFFTHHIINLKLTLVKLLKLNPEFTSD